MSAARLVLRWILFVFALSAPASLLLALAAGEPGALTGLALGTSFAIGLGFFSERLLVKIHGGERPAHVGVERTLARVAADRGWAWELPAVRLVEDPSANALIVRSFGGHGEILMTRGLISALDEPGLRAVLGHCLARLDGAEVLLQSLCAVIASGLLRLAPRQWVRFIAGAPAPAGEATTPGSFLRFLLIYPLARFWVRLGSFTPSHSGTGADKERFADAMQKVERAGKLWDLRPNPGASPLYLRGAWENRNILPF
jgi:Zn-dependent protease with chaperone function